MDWLKQDVNRPKREQRTAIRLFEDLQREGYSGAYDSVVRYVRCFRQHQLGHRMLTYR